MISTYTAFIDANVFYGARLRSLVLFVASTKIFRVRWSEKVHDEWIDALVAKLKKPSITKEELQITRNAMNQAIPDSVVSGYQHLETGLKLPDPKDNHILAAAICTHASTIVTFNLKHFPIDYLREFNIDATHPDQFLCDAFNLAPDIFAEAVKQDFEHYKRPPLSFEKYIADLKTAGVPNLAQQLEEIKILISQLAF